MTITSTCPGCGLTTAMGVDAWMWHRATRHEGRIVASPDGIHTQGWGAQRLGVPCMADRGTHPGTPSTRHLEAVFRGGGAMIYRVYCDGREFGRDYRREEALWVAAAFRSEWPGHRYYARRHR